jgi:hypothetical protein
MSLLSLVLLLAEVWKKYRLSHIGHIVESNVRTASVDHVKAEAKGAWAVLLTASDVCCISVIGGLFILVFCSCAFVCKLTVVRTWVSERRMTLRKIYLSVGRTWWLAREKTFGLPPIVTPFSSADVNTLAQIFDSYTATFFSSTRVSKKKHLRYITSLYNRTFSSGIHTEERR